MSIPKNLSIAAASTTLSLNQRRSIDRLCSGFEQDFIACQIASTERENARQANRSIKNVLDDPEAKALSPEAFAQLVEELLLTEFELVESSGSQVDRDQYYASLPDRRAAIDAALRRHQLNKTVWASEVSAWNADLDDPNLRYVRQSELARGGMGVVYRGYDRTLQRTVAIKVLDAPLIGDEEALKRFQREPRLCGNLQHPNVVPIYDTGITREGLPYFVMRLIRGQTLAELLNESRIELAGETALAIFQQICHAIAAAHRQGIIHRDIKPSNIMVADLGEIYIMDWGLSGHANVAESGEPESPAGSADLPAMLDDDSDGKLTSAGKIFGTPRYMPPEFGSQSSNRSSKRADVYCLGAVLCELLIGHHPIKFSLKKNQWGKGATYFDTSSIKLVLTKN